MVNISNIVLYIILFQLFSLSIEMNNNSEYKPTPGIVIPTPNLSNGYKKEYSLKKKLFDPPKNSPPNEFIEKLKLRLKFYNSCNNRCILHTE